MDTGEETTKKAKASYLGASVMAEDYGEYDAGYPASNGDKVTIADRLLARKLLEICGHPPLRLELWNGEGYQSSEDSPVARIMFRDRGALYKLVRNPNLHFGDLYSVGRIDIEGDLVKFLESVYKGLSFSPNLGFLKKFQTHILNRPRTNSLSGSRNNIHHHYDLGNTFYELWLDREAMQYTCAYFPDPAMTLESAQRAKMDHICRKLQLQPGEHVVEAGCGWGGLAHHMARHYGVRVRSYNISHEQVVYAREQAKAQELDDQVEYVEDDYRNISGEYDAFVSVGMLEHVGKDHYQGLGDVIDRCLTPTGRGLIHSIGRNKPELMNPWIEKRIFPGAYPPTLREMMDIFEPNDFSVLDVENLRLHYAKTLEHWLARYEQHAEQVEKMYDRPFVRAWRLYLAGSIAAFTTGALQLFQVTFNRARDNDLPWSRAHLYP
jgi:cyclopropane-fatty-acyl-phospholipid synthase